MTTSSSSGSADACVPVDGLFTVPRLVLITGVMAAGKSTVAQLLAEQIPRAVHVRGDVFRRFVVTGGVEPTPSMPAAALDHLLLRYRLAMSTADTYVRAGFTAVVQDVVVGPVLADVVSMSATRPLHVVVLDPGPEIVAEREARRGKVGYGPDWSPTALVDVLRGSTPRLGLWLDTADQTPAQTVRTILAHLPESAVHEVPSTTKAP